MSTELTHEQAAVLRASPHLNDVQHSMVHLFAESSGGRASLNDAGREALAAYDAEYAIVRKDDLAIAARGLEVEIGEHQFAGNTMPEEQAALARLREILK